MALLELLAAAAGAGGVATDFGLLAADGFDFAFDALSAHSRLLIGGGKSGAGGVGVPESECPRSGLGLALTIAWSEDNIFLLLDDEDLAGFSGENLTNLLGVVSSSPKVTQVIAVIDPDRACRIPKYYKRITI